MMPLLNLLINIQEHSLKLLLMMFLLVQLKNCRNWLIKMSLIKFIMKVNCFTIYILKFI